MDRNIVLLTFDALRRDHVSWYGYERETTPTIDRLADENAVFENAYSASSHTRGAVPSLLTGRYPDIFSDNDYLLACESVVQYIDSATGGFHSNPYISRAYGFDVGFDAFDDDLRLGRHRVLALAQRALDKLRNRHYASAETINERALSWVDSLDDEESFFLWNHYMDPHGPYCPPESYQGTFGSMCSSSHAATKLYRRACRKPESVTDTERQRQIDLYDEEIRYVDDQTDALLSALKRRDHLSDTLVILTADHGDAFGERGYYGHPRRLDSELVDVPLVVIDPDERSGATVSAPVSTLDIVPTMLAEATDADVELPGVPLQQYYRQTTVPDRKFVYMQVRGEDDDANTRWYRAQSADERAELTVNLETGDIDAESTTSQDAEIALRDHVRRRLDRERLASTEWDTDETSEDIERRLEALGYKD